MTKKDYNARRKETYNYWRSQGLSPTQARKKRNAPYIALEHYEHKLSETIRINRKLIEEMRTAVPFKARSEWRKRNLLKLPKEFKLTVTTHEKRTRYNDLRKQGLTRVQANSMKNLSRKNYKEFTNRYKALIANQMKRTGETKKEVIKRLKKQFEGCENRKELFERFEEISPKKKK